MQAAEKRAKYNSTAGGVPSAVRMMFSFSLLAGLVGVTALEALDTAAAVDQLLLAGVERMALAANFDTDLRLRGTGLDDVASGAGDGAIHIIRMDAFLHCNFTSFWIMTYGSHTQYMRSSQSPNVGYQHTPSCANGAAI